MAKILVYVFPCGVPTNSTRLTCGFLYFKDGLLRYFIFMPIRCFLYRKKKKGRHWTIERQLQHSES